MNNEHWTGNILDVVLLPAPCWCCCCCYFCCLLSAIPRPCIEYLLFYAGRLPLPDFGSNFNLFLTALFLSQISSQITPITFTTYCARYNHVLHCLLSSLDSCLNCILSICFYIRWCFSDAFTHLYKKVCPSVDPPVHWSVRNAFFFQWANGRKWSEMSRETV